MKKSYRCIKNVWVQDKLSFVSGKKYMVTFIDDNFTPCQLFDDNNSKHLFSVFGISRHFTTFKFGK